MEQISNTKHSPRPDVICLEGNGARPSHHGIGFTEEGVMYTLNSVEVCAVCYDENIFEHRVPSDGLSHNSEGGGGK